MLLKELQAAREPSDIQAQIKKSITIRELQYAVTNLKVKKSPGSDKIGNEMIINFRLAVKTKLLEI